jgi:ABC-type proline/glycine betaine transport system ATPase subunit
VGLDESHARRRPAALSGGQKQRVGIARALCAKPRYLLMDEPFGALDPLTRVDLRRLLRQLRKTENFTLVLVTHDLADARSLCDRVCVLKQGKLVETLTPDSLEKAVDPWVREFVAPQEFS